MNNFLSIILAGFLLLSSMQVFGGNDPCSSTILDPSTSTFDVFSNSGNTDSGVPAPPYGGYSGADIWFSFIMPASGVVNLIIKEGGMTNPAIAIYEGPCGNPKLLYNILDNNCNSGLSPSAALNNLMPGVEYFIRIWAENGSGDGSFSLFLSETTATSPKFLLHSDATQQGDCIQLTSASNGQHGCAWFEIPIDFTQPFTHTMTANFGTKDATGADGICLIYQANGPDYCGGSGGGIGAEGMPNSAIFEFDTWQNGNKNDPIADHCAFNINGDMDHANSINGPISLPNIEDGADHTITFVWDGSAGYELYFDGLLVLSGSYDFINNVFGGSTTAWWGYTASTGASNNQQTICPNIQNYELGTQEYQEATICEGESFNGYTETGFYVDFNGGTGNCLHQINTNVIVNAIPDPVYIDATLCEGNQYYLGGNFYYEAGVYPVYLQTFLGCDSLVVLNLEVIQSTIEIVLDNDVLDCDNEETLLNSVFNTNVNDYEVIYNWSANGQQYNEPSWLVNQPGIYNLNISIEHNGQICYTNDTRVIYIDTIAPNIIGLEDVVLDCDTINNVDFLDASMSTPKGNLSFEWKLFDNIVGNQKTQNIIEPGTYYLSLIDNNNGCKSRDSVQVTYSDDRPKIEIIPELLNCKRDSFNIQFVQDTQSITYAWNYNGVFLSEEKNPIIKKGGEYQLVVTNTKGCQTKATILISQDTLKPSVFIPDTIIPCNVNEIVLDKYMVDSVLVQIWTQNLDFTSSGFPIISEGGTYTLNVIDTTNYCEAQSDFNVTKLGNSPEIDIEIDTLNCITKSFSPEVQFDQSNIEYEWTYLNNIVSTTIDYSVNKPGIYYLQSSSINGCLSIDSLIVVIDTITPTIGFTKPDTIDCGSKTVNLQANINKADQFIWSGPQLLSPSLTSQVITTPGIYKLKAINNQNGCQTYDSIEVFSNVFVPVYTISTDTIDCNQPTIKLPFTISSLFENIIWSGPDNFSSTIISPEVTNSGVYNLHIDVEGACDIDTSIIISEDFILPSVDVIKTDITCDNPESTIQLSLDSNAKSWKWVSPNATILDKTEFKVNKSGLQYLTIIGNNGCAKLDTIEILSFLDLPTSIVEKSGDIDCAISEVELSSTPSSNDVEHLWTLPDGTTLITADIASGLDGFYNLTIINQYGCENFYSMNVEAHTTPPFFILEHSNLDCSHLKASISASGNELNITSINWEGPENYTSSILEDSIITNGTYKFKAINNYGCVFFDSIEVKELIQYSSLTLLSPDTLIIDEDDIQGMFEVEVDSDLDYTLKWLPTIGLTCDDCENPEITEGYAFSYTLTIENEYGCQTQITTHIREKEKPVDIHIPNIISVDGNSINDGFTFYGNAEKIKYIENLMIFDRWGNKVFHEKEIPINEPKSGWQGRLNGQFIEQGVYIYYGKITLLNGKEQEYKGDVTVIR